MRGILVRMAFVVAAVLLLLLVARCGLITSHRRAAEPRDIPVHAAAQQPPSEVPSPSPESSTAPAPALTAPATAQPTTTEPALPLEPELAAAVPRAPAAAPPAATEPTVPREPELVAPVPRAAGIAPTPPPSRPPPPAVEHPAPPQPAATPAAPSRPAPPVAGATPAETGHRGAAPAATTPPPAPLLDLSSLKQELKDTKAIGFFSKLTLKNQMDDLVAALRKFHQGQGKVTLADLRRSYELLVMKVLSLVQDEDHKLASDIVSSREAIWSILADPKKFAALQL